MVEIHKNESEGIHPFSSQFISKELESQFRQHTMSDDKKRSILLFLISIIALLMITCLDFQTHGISSTFFKLAIPKSLIILAIAWILCCIYRTNKKNVFDKLLFAFLVIFTLSKIYSGYIRPTNYLPGAVFEVVIVMAVYLLLPIPILFRAIPALSLTFFSPFIAKTTILIMPHMFAHLIGIVFSSMLHKNMRQQYLLLLREIKLKKKLEESENEIKFISRRLAEQNKIFKEHSNKDQLTGINNRRSLYERIEEQWSKAIRKKEDSGIVFIDIDHFKQVNDTYGHLAGDMVIKGVVNAIENLIRPYDLLGRWGGEEFVLYLPETDINQSKTIANRLRQAVQDEEFFFEDNKISVTISLGISSKASSDTHVLTEFLDHADKALYVAKKTGRNKAIKHRDASTPKG